MNIKIMDDERLDDLNCKGLKILQKVDGFCFGMDSVLIANFAKVPKREAVVADLGTGTGIISILVAGKQKIEKIFAIEIQDELVDMAKRSVEYNGLNDKIEVINADVVGISKGEFNKNLNLTKGIIGDYKIIEYEEFKNDIISKIYKRRIKLFKKISQKLGTKKAALISSVAFGYKSELDQDYKSLMKNLGISHIISISGMHLALVYSILRKVFGVKLSLIIAFIYVLFTGAPASAIRAYIMILIF